MKRWLEALQPPCVWACGVDPALLHRWLCTPIGRWRTSGALLQHLLTDRGLLAELAMLRDVFLLASPAMQVGQAWGWWQRVPGCRVTHAARL